MAGFLFITIGGSKGTFDMTPSDACGKSEIMLADAYVTNVKWFKKTNMPFHEFLVVYVTTHTDPNLKEAFTTVIAIDRSVEGIAINHEEGSTTGRPNDSDLLFYGDDGKEIHPDPDALLLSPAPPIRASFSTSMESLKSVSSSSSSLRTRAAADQLHFSCNGTDDFLKEDKWVKSVLCRQLKIKVGYLTLAHLAVLARAVHDHHPNYKATQYQCYWYAEIIYTMIQRIVQDAVGPNAQSPPFKESISHPKRDVGQFWTERLGFFKVRRGVPKTPELVYQKYQEDWATTEKTLTAAMGQKKLKSLTVSIVIVLGVQILTVDIRCNRTVRLNSRRRGRRGSLLKKGPKNWRIRLHGL